MGKKKQKKIEHSGSIAKSWSMMRGSFPAVAYWPPRAFKYGDIVHRKSCPDQREMVIGCNGDSVTTIILDTVDMGHQGQTTGHYVSTLERVE